MRTLEAPEHDSVAKVEADLRRDSAMPLDDIGHHDDVLRFYADRLAAILKSVSVLALIVGVSTLTSCKRPGGEYLQPAPDPACIKACQALGWKTAVRSDVTDAGAACDCIR